MIIIKKDVLPSTNDFIKEHYASLDNYTIVRANYQTSGKGRLSRTWEALENNNIDYDRMTQSFINAMQTIDLQVVMNSAKVAECIAGDMDRTSGVRQSLYERGVNI